MKHVIRFSARVPRERSIRNLFFQSPLRMPLMPALRANSYHSLVGCQTFHWRWFGSYYSKRKNNWNSFSFRSSKCGPSKKCLDLSAGSNNMSLRFSGPIGNGLQQSKCKAPTWLLLGLLCYSSFESVHADAPGGEGDNGDQGDLSATSYSHGKKVCTEYSVTGIPGDGRCLFRSVAHGACLRAGNPAPNENVQRKLADELRARVADEFVKRRKETEWFIEGDFDTYVEQMRRPHVWGGEPELLMASHVLQMPITVYMQDEDSGGLIAIAEYGQEYGKDKPINVLYHGCGHYDALQIPERNRPRSRM